MKSPSNAKGLRPFLESKATINSVLEKDEIRNGNQYEVETGFVPISWASSTPPKDTLPFRQIGFLEPSQSNETLSKTAYPLICNNLCSIRNIIVNPFCVLNLKTHASGRGWDPHCGIHHAIAVNIVG